MLPLCYAGPSFYYKTKIYKFGQRWWHLGRVFACLTVDLGLILAKEHNFFSDSTYVFFCTTLIGHQVFLNYLSFP